MLLDRAWSSPLYENVRTAVVCAKSTEHNHVYTALREVGLQENMTTIQSVSDVESLSLTCSIQNVAVDLFLAVVV